MTMHTTFAGLNLATSGGTTWDDVATTGFYPTGDNEIQVRGGGTPKLIGLHSCTGEITQIGATTDYDRFKLQLNTWPAAHYMQWHPHIEFQTAAKFGGCYSPIDWYLPGIPLEQDADWTLQVNSTTASMTMVAALYLSYGTAHPYRGGQIIGRMNDFGTDAGVFPAFAGAETISDFDPRMTYRLAGIQLGNIEDQNSVAVTVTSSSNSTSVGALIPSATATTLHPDTTIKWFPHDSILVSGNETVTINASSQAAEKPTVYTFWEVYGGNAGGTGGAIGAARSVGPSLTPTRVGGQGFGGLFGIGR